MLIFSRKKEEFNHQGLAFISKTIDYIVSDKIMNTESQ